MDASEKELEPATTCLEGRAVGVIVFPVVFPAIAIGRSYR
jgi:hypothetical protein